VIVNLFTTGRNEHPLADAKFLKKVLADLPSGDLEVIDEIAGWLEALGNADAIRPEALLAATCQLDEAAQPALRRVTRGYLTSLQRSRAEEERCWLLCCNYWQHSAALYGALCMLGAPGDRKSEARKGSDALKPRLSLLLARQLAALAAFGKWRHFHYERLSAAFWQSLGAAFLTSERLALANKSLSIYPTVTEPTSPGRQYVQFLAFEASSPASLEPLEIELVEKLVAHFAPLFVLGATDRPDNVYWVDAALGEPPLRLAKRPAPSPTVRLLAFGSAPQRLAELTGVVARGGEVPPELALGGQYPPHVVLRVLHHLAAYWGSQPPLRVHQRHLVKTGRLRTLHGFEHCLEVLRGEPVSANPVESWQVENVSLGGFAVGLPGGRRELLRIGELVALQPEGGDNWLIAVVRRYGRDRDRDVQSAGLQTLSKQPALLALHVSGQQVYAADRGDPAVLLDDPKQADDVRVLLPASTFDLGESYDSKVDGRHALLSPVQLIEAARDYQIGRFRVRYAH
jgi:hypothetical protein